MELAPSGATWRTGSISDASILAIVSHWWCTSCLPEGDLGSFQEAAERKMMESDVLRNQAAANTKEQFVHSPALRDELMNAIMDTMAAHQSMVRQALNSDAIRAAMLASMLAKGGLWEAFRQRTGAAGHM